MIKRYLNLNIFLDALIVLFICSYTGILSGTNGILLLCILLLCAFLLFSILNKSLLSTRYFVDIWFLLLIFLCLSGLMNIKTSFRYILPFILGFVVLNRKTSNNDYKFIVKLLKIVSIILATSILFQCYLPNPFYKFAQRWFYYSNQYSSVYYAGYNSHQFSGLFCEVSCSAFVLALGYTAVFCELLSKKPKPILNILYLCLIYYAVYLTGKRSLVLLLPIISYVVFFFVMINKLSAKHIIFLIVVFILLLFNLNRIFDWISELLSNKTSHSVELSGREKFWQLAMDMFSSSPIIGKGINSFDVYFNQSGIRQQSYSFAGAHNAYLQILGETGILGLILFAFILMQLWIRGIKNIKNDKKNGKELLYDYFSIMTLLVFCGYGLTGNVLHQPQQLLVLFVLGNIINRNFIKNKEMLGAIKHENNLCIEKGTAMLPSLSSSNTVAK